MGGGIVQIAVESPVRALVGLHNQTVECKESSLFLPEVGVRTETWRCVVSRMYNDI